MLTFQRMSWLGNLFFKKKNAQEVEDWAKGQQQTSVAQYASASTTLKAGFPGLMDNVRKALTALQQAELRNPNVPERAKHYITGNKDRITQITHRFLENLFAPSTPTDLSQMDVIFKQYVDNSKRPATILSEFFGQEIKTLRQTLADIEDKFKVIKTLDAKREEYQHILDMIERIRQIVKEQKETEQEQKQLDEQLAHLKKKQESLRTEKEEFTKNPAYLGVKEDILTSAKERQEAEQAITDLFLPLQVPLRKFAYKTKHAKLAKYAENPLETLIHDYSLSILKHVEELTDALANNELDLKPEKIHKALESLKKMDKESLGGMIHRYAKAKKREADIHHDVAQRPVIKEYEQYAIDLKKMSTDIAQIESTISKFAPASDEELREQLAESLRAYKIILV